MSLRILALAAPQFPRGTVGDRALSSADPASLFNACRVAAMYAEEGIGAWGDSNWASSRQQRRESVLLLHSLKEGLDELRPILEDLRPNLVLIGAMSVCLPGAIGCAEYIKEVLGEEVCIVLGGRHPTESMYTYRGEVTHHPSSPLRLMAEGAIPEVFDIVVSGDGEYVIPAIGELVASHVQEGRPAAHCRRDLCDLGMARGRWIAGACVDGLVDTVCSSGNAIVYDKLPAPCAMFGVRTGFDVFGGRLTAHAFSDVGRGCIYDCDFCSERRSVTGRPAQVDTSPERLFRQFVSAVRVIKEDFPGMGVSAFVEDSTLLTGAPALIQRFVDLMEKADLDIEFGCQLTIDQILARPKLLASLRNVGMRYLFIGLETLSPTVIGGMSKDVGRKMSSWVQRAESVFDLLASLDIDCGAAVLFGLGEEHEHRMALIEQMEHWRFMYGFPTPISMNWAVQHPLIGQDGGTQYTYTDWAVPEGPFLEAFRDFGEASTIYPLAGQKPPVLEEVLEIRDAIVALNQQHVPEMLSA